MRAGKLDREVTLQRSAEAISATGAPVLTWTTLATARAELVENAIADANRESGSATETTLTFRVRYIDLTLADQLQYAGDAYRLLSIKEIGRKRGLDVVAERLGP